MKTRFNVMTVSILIAILGISGCPSEESNLVSFQGSACKKDAAFAEIMPLYSTFDSDELAGLQCVAWKRADGGMKVDLINFSGACGADWHGKAVVDGDRVTVTVENPRCMVADCGSCIYDWSFDVDGVDPEAAITVVAEQDTCPGEQEIDRVTATIPAGAPEGIICNYASYGSLEWHAMSTGESGMIHMPCVGSEESEDGTAPPCDGDMVCAENGDGNETHEICLAPCTEEADCPHPDLLSCQEGLCRIAEPWLI